MAWWNSVLGALKQAGLIIFFILQLVWIPVVWILGTLFNILIILSAPLLYIAHFLARLCYAPVHFLGRFEV